MNHALLQNCIFCLKVVLSPRTENLQDSETEFFKIVFRKIAISDSFLSLPLPFIFFSSFYGDSVSVQFVECY